MNAGALFAEARHVQMLRYMRLIQVADRAELHKRIILTIAVGWLPLALIALYHLASGDGITANSFFPDAAVHARLLLAVPLLLASEYIVLPRLEAIARYFENSSLLAPSQQPVFAEILASARARSNGVWPSALLPLIVYALIILLVWLAPFSMLPAWQRGRIGGLSLAGVWHMFVSLPILLGLVLAWLWRLIVWTAFLGRVSRIGLCVVASHPDRAGGLQFLALSPRIFAPLALAMGTVVAGTMADRIIREGQSPIGHEIVPVITALILVALFASPPLLFSRVLMVTWRSGVFLYGDLAMRLGSRFEKKWLDRTAQPDGPPFAEPDFSAVADMYGVVSNVYGMRLLLLEYRGLLIIAASTLLPFLPVWLSAVPLSTFVHHLVGVFL